MRIDKTWKMKSKGRYETGLILSNYIPMTQMKDLA